MENIYDSKSEDIKSFLESVDKVDLDFSTIDEFERIIEGGSASVASQFAAIQRKTATLDDSIRNEKSALKRANEWQKIQDNPLGNYVKLIEDKANAIADAQFWAAQLSKLYAKSYRKVMGAFKATKGLSIAKDVFENSAKLVNEIKKEIQESHDREMERYTKIFEKNLNELIQQNKIKDEVLIKLADALNVEIKELKQQFSKTSKDKDEPEAEKTETETEDKAKNKKEQKELEPADDMQADEKSNPAETAEPPAGMSLPEGLPETIPKNRLIKKAENGILFCAACGFRTSSERRMLEHVKREVNAKKDSSHLRMLLRQ